MSLNWDTRKVADTSALVEPNGRGGEDWSVRTCTVLGLMYWTGIDEVSDKTIEDLWAKCDFAQRVFDGPVFQVPFMLVGSVRLTRDDLTPYLGMTANTFPRKTMPAYLKLIWGWYTDSMAREAATV